MRFNKLTSNSLKEGEAVMTQKILSKIMTLSLCVGLGLVFSVDISSAAMGKRFKDNELKHYHKKNTLSVSGEISTIKSTYIGVITHRDKDLSTETETLFLIDEDVTFKKKTLAELLEGDQVKVTYENITEPDPEDEENDKFVQRVTKEIQYLSPKSKSLKSGKK